MTAADLARLPLRRVRPAIVLRPRERTQPLVFIMPSGEEWRAAWASYLAGAR